MTQQITTSPLLSLGAGILVLLKPKLLNYIIAVYLIADGALRLLGRRTEPGGSGTLKSLPTGSLARRVNKL